MKYKNIIKYTSLAYYVIYIIKGVSAVLYLFEDAIKEKVEKLERDYESKNSNNE